MITHLIANKKGKYGAQSCDQKRGKLASAGGALVETVGEVTCEGCQRFVLSLYGKRARRLYPNLKENVDAS